MPSSIGPKNSVIAFHFQKDVIRGSWRLVTLTVRDLLPQLTCASTNSNFGLVSTRYDTVLHRLRNTSLSPSTPHLATVHISIAKYTGGWRDLEAKTTRTWPIRSKHGHVRIQTLTYLIAAESREHQHRHPRSDTPTRRSSKLVKQ